MEEVSCSSPMPELGLSPTQCHCEGDEYCEICYDSSNEEEEPEQDVVEEEEFKQPPKKRVREEVSIKTPDLMYYFSKFKELSDWDQIGICRAYANYLAAKIRPGKGKQKQSNHKF